MKTRYAPSFVATLARCGLTPTDWHGLLQQRRLRALRYWPEAPRRIRQQIRQVQRAHSSRRRVWIGGRCL